VLHLKGVALCRLGRATETLELVREALDIARELNSILVLHMLAADPDHRGVFRREHARGA